MTEELSLNDDPDSLMIEETSTLGLPNISDITRFKIDFELPAGKIFSKFSVSTGENYFSVYLADFWDDLFYWGALKISPITLCLFTTFLLPIALCNIIEYNRCRHIM